MVNMNETAVKRMTMETAIKKSKRGEFEFIEDAHVGLQVVRYQTPSGKWKQMQLSIK